MKRVLFLCTTNSGRSQMAEAIFNHLSDGSILAYSAGSDPGPATSLLAVESLKRSGIDMSQQRPKHYSELPYDSFDAVITLCDQMAEHCVYWPGGPVTAHWSTPGEGAFQGSDNERETYIDGIRDRLTGQVSRLIVQLSTVHDEDRLKAEISAIAIP